MLILSILFVWLLLATVLEHVLAVTPASIPKAWKKALYYFIVWPEIAAGYIKGLLEKWSFQWLAVSSWFRS